MKSLNDVTALPVTLAGHMNLQAVHNLPPPLLSFVCCAVDLIPYLNVFNFYNWLIAGEEASVIVIDCVMSA